MTGLLRLQNTERQAYTEEKGEDVLVGLYFTSGEICICRTTHSGSLPFG